MCVSFSLSLSLHANVMLKRISAAITIEIYGMYRENEKKLNQFVNQLLSPSREFFKMKSSVLYMRDEKEIDFHDQLKVFPSFFEL